MTLFKRSLLYSLPLCSLILLVIPLSPARQALAADGDTVTVEASGEAPIYNDDVSQAKDKATEDALRNAVEKAVGTVVTSDSETKDFALVSDRVLTHAKGYVKTFDIVDQTKADGTLTIKIRAAVGKADLTKDVDALISLIHRKGKPKILIMVSEQNIGQPAPDAWWTKDAFTTNLDIVENVFIEAWQPQGFSFVDPQALRGKIKVTKGLQSANVDDSEAKTFGGKAGAQVVIIGKAVANQAPGKAFGTNMVTARANMSIRAIRVDTGDILATSTVDGGSIALDPTTAGSNALKETSKKMAEDLKGKIMNKWLEELNGGQGIKLTVNNVKTAKALRTFRNTIESQIRGISAVHDRSYSHKVAEFELDMKGTTQDLAVELEAKKFGGEFSVEVNEVSANAIEVTMK